MAANTEPIFGLTPNLCEITFVNADGTTNKTAFDPGANNAKLTAINVVSDDTATVNMRVYVYDGSTAYLIGTVPVVTLSGTNGVAPAVNILDPTYIPCLDRDGELFLPAAYTVQVSPLAAVTSPKTVTVVATGVDY